LLTSLLALVGNGHAEGQDVVEFGASRLVGEVKRLDRGKLYFKTGATDTIAIDWAEVTRFETSQRLRVEGRDGRITFGSFRDGAEPLHLQFVQDSVTSQIPLASVTAFEPLETGFWERLDVSTSVGYSFAKSTGVEQLSLSAGVAYETERRSRTLSLSARTSESDANSSSVRRTAEYRTLRLRSDSPRFSGLLGSYEDNDALDLEHRVLAGLLVGREFYPLPNQRFRPYFGLAVSQEQLAGSDSSSNTELVLGTTVDWYRFRSPELDLSSTLTIFPSINDFGRLRSNLDISLRWEIVEDLFWELSFYHDYDNNASSAEGDNEVGANDYGITTGLGWSW
jgi:hypothetical protein